MSTVPTENMRQYFQPDGQPERLDGPTAAGSGSAPTSGAYAFITSKDMLCAADICAKAAYDPLNHGEIASILLGASRILANTSLRPSVSHLGHSAREGDSECGYPADLTRINRVVAAWRDMTAAEMRLRCGELTAREILTVRAVLKTILANNQCDPRSPKTNQL